MSSGQLDTAKNLPDVDFTKEMLELFGLAESRESKRNDNSSENKSAASDHIAPSSSVTTYREALWSSMPSSAEMASTTAEEKLRQMRDMFLRESYENCTDSLDLLPFLQSQVFESFFLKLIMYEGRKLNCFAFYLILMK